MMSRTAVVARPRPLGRRAHPTAQIARLERATHDAVELDAAHLAGVAEDGVSAVQCG
jgi:hypothetical protein